MKTKRKKRTAIKAKISPNGKTVAFKTFRLDRWKEAISSHPKLFALILLSLVGTLLYINSIHNEFVFDDIPRIVKNKSIRSLTNIPDILGLTSGSPSYRPIRDVSYAIDYQFSEFNPVGYHLSNVFYHILTSYLVFLVASLITKNRKVAWVTALLFIAHPIQTESVTYMSGRRDILSTLFFLMGFYFFLKQREFPSKKYLFLTIVSYILSLFSKEMGVTLPAVLLLYDLLRKSPYEDIEGDTFSNPFLKFLAKIRRILKRNWILYIALFLIAILFIFYRVVLKNPSRQEGFYGGTISSNFLTVFRIWVFYIRILFLPISLNASHGFPISKSIFEFRAISSICILLAILILLIRLIQKRELYAFSGFWFFITLFPVSHIFPHHILLAERFLYLPSFGFLLAFGLLFVDLLQNERWRPFLYIFLIVLFSFYSYGTIHRNLDWKNRLTLWADTAKKSPDYPPAKKGLIMAHTYRQHGHYDEAIAALLEILEKEPPNHEIYNELGVSYMLMGDNEKAIGQFERSIEVRSDNPKAYNNLGVIYLKKDPDRAITEFRKAISFDPDYAEAYNNLAKALATKGLTDEAIEKERKAIEIDMTVPEYHFNLAKLYENKELIHEAIQEHKQALKLDSKFFEARYQLGILYTRLEKNNEAILEFEKAVKLNPASGKTHFMLGINLIKVGDRKNAIRSLERALPLISGEKEQEGIKSLLNKLQSVPK